MKAASRVHLAYLLPLIAITSSTMTFGAPRDLYHRQAVMAGTGLNEPFRLPDSLLIEGTEQALLGDSLLITPGDYSIDYIRGTLHFNRTFSVEDTLFIYYQVFPFQLRTSYFHPIRTIHPGQLAAADTLETLPPPESAPTGAFDTGALRKRGTLVRGITIGTDRDLSVESGLNLQVEGRLGRDVDVLALLSDQNTPIQPEGNTATLQEIDKVLIEVQSTHFAASLGDYELEFKGPRFASYFRKLQGAKLEGRTVDDRLTLSGAVSKGQYHSNYFLGQEGNQGPYQLTDKEGRSGILVLAGTERVWLDGERLQRGENNDYTIEYGIGEITFTPRRLITADSRITVDFQYSADAYGRDIYATRGEAHLLDEKVGVRTTVISESDARTNPLSFVLTDSSRAALAAAGDDPAQAEVLQVVLVDTGDGSYINDTLSWGGQTYPVFTYVGPDSNGYLNVAFSYVGQGNGDYQRVASAAGFYYSWAGPGEGDYAPVLRLPLPERRRIADVEVWTNPTTTTRIKIEGAASDLDHNTFSTLDDNNNVGVAWLTEGHWQSSSADTPEDFSHLMVDTHVREVESRFSQIDRYQEVEYDRQWDLDAVTSAGESVREATLTIRPLYPWSNKVNYGFLNKRADGFRSERWRGETRLGGLGLPSVVSNADWIRSSSDLTGRNSFWTRGQTTASYPVWRFTPSLHYEREHKHDAYADSLSGFLFNIYNAGLSYQTGPVTLKTIQELRDDQKYRQSILKNFSTARTQTYKTELRSWRNLSGDALFTHRTRTFDEADSTETRTDLMEVNLGWTPLSRSVDLLAHYRVNNTRVSTVVQTPIYVGPGQGTHVKVGDLFFEDPDGDYILVAQSTGQFQPVVELEGSFSLDLDPHRLPEKQRDRIPEPWRLLASETILNFTEKTKERDVWALYRLDFSKFQGDSTLFGNVLLREDLFLFRHRRDLTFRLRGEIAQSLSNLYLSGGQETDRRLISFRIRRSFTEQWSTQIDVGRETDERTYRATNASSRDILTYNAAIEPVYRPTRDWEIGSRFVGQRDRDGVEDIVAYRYGLEPYLIRSFRQKGRLELRGEWHHVATDAASLPYEMAEGDPPGDNFRWDIRVDYRISKYMTATLSYNGSKDADREAIHIGRAELKAFF